MVLPPEHPKGIEARAKAKAEVEVQEQIAQAKVKAEIQEYIAKAKAKEKGKRGKGKQVVPLDSLQQINLNAAGLDIGAAEIWACVPEGRDEVSVRIFESYTIDLHGLADWLEACGVETVAMESTGVYWVPVYEILEERGFEVNLVNARHLKNVTGRKTDAEDAQWIQQLHTYGLLQASFQPSEQIAALRAYVRHRDNLLRYRSGHVQHMQKALHLMNLQLTNVISDITGQTGMLIMRAIVAGEHDPVKLARFRNPRCASSEDEIAKALHGHYRAEHLFALQQALELYDFYTNQIKACDEQLHQQYEAFTPQVDLAERPLPPRSRGRSGNEPDFDLRSQLYQMTGVDLTQIDGLNVLTVQQILSEIGLDMSKWPTVKHFTSWLGVAPNHQITGGKVRRRNTKKTSNRANTALRLAAQSVGRSDSALGAFYRRKRAQLGAPKAITATAHKIARIIYVMLKNKASYQDPGADYYQQQHRQRAIANLKRKAKRLGLEVVPTTT
jgi:transposase